MYYLETWNVGRESRSEERRGKPKFWSSTAVWNWNYVISSSWSWSWSFNLPFNNLVITEMRLVNWNNHLRNWVYLLTRILNLSLFFSSSLLHLATELALPSRAISNLPIPILIKSSLEVVHFERNFSNHQCQKMVRTEKVLLFFLINWRKAVSQPNVWVLIERSKLVASKGQQYGELIEMATPWGRHNMANLNPISPPGPWKVDPLTTLTRNIWLISI